MLARDREAAVGVCSQMFGSALSPLSPLKRRNVAQSLSDRYEKRYVYSWLEQVKRLCPPGGAATILHSLPVYRILARILLQKLQVASNERLACETRLRGAETERFVAWLRAARP